MYSNEELVLIEDYQNLPRKQCKECKKDLPLCETFFRKEKRIKDGFENKCRKCRGGNLLINQRKDSPPSINKELIKLNSVNKIYEYFIKENVLPYRSFILDNHVELFKYLISKENIQIKQLNKLDRQWFQDRKLYSSLLRIYNGSVFQFVNAAYPDLFKPWEFITVGRHFWEDRNNRITALNWLVEQLIKDNVINSIEDIPRKVNGNTFNDYHLGTLLGDYYKAHVYNAFNDIYPNKFYQWQYTFITEGYLDNKENRIQSLKELIKHLNLNIKDIPKVFSYEYFNRPHEDYGYRFKYILDKYYNSLYDYVNEVYPNVFKEGDLPYKNHYPTLDNIIVRSEPERQLHHLFMSLELNYKYGDHVGRMSINDITVLPDWYIYKDNKIVLVEYYGMLDMNDVDFGYTDKYEMKDKLYRGLCKSNSQYEYMALYKEDMMNNYTGVLSKLNEYGII